MNLAPVDIIRLRAAVNEWVSEKFPRHRRYLSHSQPEYCAKKKAWSVALGTKNVNGHSVVLGNIIVDYDGVIVRAVRPSRIVEKLEGLLADTESSQASRECLQSTFYDFRLGDGIQGAVSFEDGEIDLLLTDPPYGISKSYTCEQQVPRRLRKDGRDFIMPKGNFGGWDQPVEPSDWLGSHLA